MKLVTVYHELLKNEDLEVLGLTIELELDGIHCYHPFCDPFVYKIKNDEIINDSTVIKNVARHAFEWIQNSALDLIQKHNNLRFSYQHCHFYHPDTGQIYRNLEELQLA